MDILLLSLPGAVGYMRACALNRGGQKQNCYDLFMSVAAWDGETLKEIREGKYQEQTTFV
jgi:hypothetical protein